jgi:hypothetical protein
MKSKVKAFLMRFVIGRKVWNYLRRKKNAFRSASIGPFQYLDRWWKKKTIDRICEEAFDRIFILLRAMHPNGDIYEFGTYQGYSALLLAKNIRKFQFDQTSLHLFDSFEGLPEGNEIDSRSYEFCSKTWIKGSMSAPDGMEKTIYRRLSKILGHNRIHIVRGFFENTLERYFSHTKPAPASLIHIDCDLYSASKYVLTFLFEHEVIQDGTIVIFDDWMTSRGNPNLGQRKATKEVLEKYPAWFLEPYSNYGAGSHVFVAHDLRVNDAKPCARS